MKRPVFLASLLTSGLVPFIAVQACGPDFSPDVFVHLMHPDHPAQFAAGKLGILLLTYPRADLTIAYRYLSGGTLSPEEQSGYKPTLSVMEQARADDAADAPQAEAANNGSPPAEPPDPADVWRKAHARFG